LLNGSRFYFVPRIASLAALATRNFTTRLALIWTVSPVAGLWDRWIKPPVRGEFNFNDLDEPPPSRVIETFSIITTTANPMVAAVHERMPVILHPSHWQWWIDDRQNGDYVKSLLRPYFAEDMDCCRVSPLINNAKNDTPECIRPG